MAPPGQCISSPAAYLLGIIGTTPGGHVLHANAGCASGAIGADETIFQSLRSRPETITI
jgi:hypothetical protein